MKAWKESWYSLGELRSGEKTTCKAASTRLLSECPSHQAIMHTNPWRRWVMWKRVWLKTSYHPSKFACEAKSLGKRDITWESEPLEVMKQIIRRRFECVPKFRHELMKAEFRYMLCFPHPYVASLSSNYFFKPNISKCLQRRNAMN